MNTFAVNKDNDLFIGEDGNLAISEGLPAIMQSCQNIAQSQLGEMFLNISRGIPYFEVVFNSQVNISQFLGALRFSFLQVEGVTEVTNLTAQILKNTLIYSATINTNVGQGLISDAVTI